MTTPNHHLLCYILQHLPLYDYLRLTPLNRTFHHHSKQHLHTHYPFLYHYSKHFLYQHQNLQKDYNQNHLYQTLLTYQHVKTFYQIFFYHNQLTPNQNLPFLQTYLSQLQHNIHLQNFQFLNQNLQLIRINPIHHRDLKLLTQALSNPSHPQHNLSHSIHYLSINNKPYRISGWMRNFQGKRHHPYHTIKRLLHYFYLLLQEHLQTLCMTQDIPLLIKRFTQFYHQKRQQTPFKQPQYIYCRHHTQMNQPCQNKILYSTLVQRSHPHKENHPSPPQTHHFLQWKCHLHQHHTTLLAPPLLLL